MPRTQVLDAPGETTINFWAVNEINVAGPHTLRVTADSAAGKRLFEKDFPVTLTGGDVYGQLMREGVKLALPADPGMTRVRASLLPPDGTEAMAGDDDVLAVDWKDGMLGGAGAVIDGPDRVGRFLRDRRGLAAPDYAVDAGRLDWVVAAAPPDKATALPLPADALRGPDGRAPGLAVTFYNDADFADAAVRRTAGLVDVSAPTARRRSRASTPCSSTACGRRASWCRRRPATTRSASTRPARRP